MLTHVDCYNLRLHLRLRNTRANGSTVLGAIIIIVTMVVSALYQKAYDACRIAVGSRDHVIGLYTQSYSSTIDRMFPSLPDLSL